MQRRYISIFLMMWLLAGSVFAFPRKVLFQEYTAQWCGPCGQYAPTFHSWLEDPLENDEVTVLITHISTDPWYDIDPDACDEASNYYGVTGIPDIRVDGVYSVHPADVNQYNGYFNERRAIDSPVEIIINTVSTLDNIEVTATVNSADEAVSGNHKIRFAIESLHWDHYTGSNGLGEWHHDLMLMAPDFDGLDFSINANSTEEFTVNFPWPYQLQGQVLEWTNVKVVAYIQDDSSREIIQSNWTDVVPAPYDMAVTVENEHSFVNPGSESDGTFLLRNKGHLDDIYDVTVDVDLPDGWDFYFTTPGGQSAENTTITVTNRSEFQSTVTFVTDDDGAEKGNVTLTFTSQGDPTTPSWTTTFHTMSAPELLLLNSADGAMYSEYYSAALNQLPVELARTYAVWDVETYWFPADQLDQENLQAIVWYGSDNNMIADVMLAVRDFVLDGGKLFVNGSSLANTIRFTDLGAVLGLESAIDYANAMNVQSPAGSTLGEGLSFDVGGGDGSGEMGSPVQFNMNDIGEAGLVYNGIPTRRSCVTTNTEDYKTVTFGFPFEAVNTAEERQELINVVLAYLYGNESSIDNASGQNLLPTELSLSQNYPNPFNPTTEINFTVPAKNNVKLSVFNVMGQEVAVLVNSLMDVGNHSITFDASHLTSGIYFYRITASGQTLARKMLLCK